MLWRYLKERGDADTDEYLFVTNGGMQLAPRRIFKIISTIGKRAGIHGATMYRFRHTCAINYLRNGGDPYSLQIMLGYSTMDMVKRYLMIAQADLERSHKRASPVDNWRL